MLLDPRGTRTYLFSRRAKGEIVGRPCSHQVLGSRSHRLGHNLPAGRAVGDPEQMTLDEYTKALERVPDDKLFPELPAKEPLTIAPDRQEGSIFVKRPGLYRLG